MLARQQHRFVTSTSSSRPVTLGRETSGANLVSIANEILGGLAVPSSARTLSTPSSWQSRWS